MNSRKAATKGRKSLSRRDFLKVGSVASASLFASSHVEKATAQATKRTSGGGPLNVVLFTSDDNDAESLGCYGCTLPNVTPNIDKLAAQSSLLSHMHTTDSTCMSSRLSLMTGMYPQTNGHVGGVRPLKNGVTTLALELKKAGYYTALVQKDPNYAPSKAFQWDRHSINSANWDPAWKSGDHSRWPGWGSPEAFYALTKELISEAATHQKPFFLHLNTTDPHRPWPGSIDEVTMLHKWAANRGQKPAPLRPFATNYSPVEVPVPGYLPDLPGVRVDVAQYFSALHRADKTVGRVVDALKEKGVLENTVFIYLADQGASLPTSKQNLYRYSTLLPVIINWPKVTTPGTKIADTMLSIVDLMPTILEGLGLAAATGIDGRSFFHKLKAGQGSVRDHVFTSYNFALPNIQVFPMRGVQSRDFLYIYNAWHKTKPSWLMRKFVKYEEPTKYKGPIDPLAGLAWSSMQWEARHNRAIGRRVNFIMRRVQEEFYDLRADPYCLNNLISKKSHATRIAEMRELLDAHMAATNDGLLPKFRGKGEIPPQWLAK